MYAEDSEKNWPTSLLNFIFNTIQACNQAMLFNGLVFACALPSG